MGIEFKSTQDIVKEINETTIYNNIRSPRIISQPIICNTDLGEKDLMVFITECSVKELSEGYISSPNFLVFLDFVTGEIKGIQKLQTATKRYFINWNSPIPLKSDNFINQFQHLDNIRKKYLQKNKFPEKEYWKYKKTLIDITPPDYREFYLSHSI